MKRLLPLALPLLLAACPESGSQAPAPAATTATPAPAATPATSGANAELDRYRWRLQDATDANGQRIDAAFPGPDNVLTLSFEAGNLGITGGCNRQGGSYSLEADGTLTIGDLRSTMMACAAPLMAADEAVGQLLLQPLQARVEAGSPPKLLLVSASGAHSTWIGEASAEARYGGPGERVFLEVAPQRVPCNHPLIPDYQCLQVREIRYGENGVKQSPPGEWQSLYEDIEGFTFVPGERKVLRLKKFTRDPAPADASSVVYVLDMVVESEIVPEGEQE